MESYKHLLTSSKTFITIYRLSIKEDKKDETKYLC
jgi:hypothetical protein